METTKNFNPSIYQQAIFDFVTSGSGNAVVDAVAGSGKTTTMIQALGLLENIYKGQKDIAFLAFGNKIMDELKLKIGQRPRVEVKTLHSLGFQGLRKTFNYVKLDDNKYNTYLYNAFKMNIISPTITLDESEIAIYRSNIRKLVGLYRVNLCKSVSDLQIEAIKHNIVIYDNELEMAQKTVIWGQQDVNVIDYTDMIYMAVTKRVNVPKFDFIFIDECQDLSNMQRELFLMSLKPEGRFLAVGDPRQAIFGFAGADVQSFELLKAIPNTKHLPLSVCYRCPEDIVRLAQTLVPHLEWNPTRTDKGIINRDAKLNDIKDSDLVLCRNTAPLVGLCMNYIARGVKAYVQGKDIGLNLINMVKNTKKRNCSDAIDRLYMDLGKLAAKMAKKTGFELPEIKQLPEYTNMEDKIRAIETLSQNMVTVDALINRIQSIFKEDQTSGICLSTVHKAKGLESNHVYIICEEKFYNKYAMRIEWSAEQERNLVYVAYTRAKKSLNFIPEEEYSCK